MDSDLARFLEIKPQTLSSWYSRNTFDIDILYSKCVGINADFLLTGKGEIFKNEPIERINTVQEPMEEYKIKPKLVAAQKKTIEVLENVVDDLRNDKEVLNTIIKSILNK
jgi:hypothetical protein